MRALYYLLLAVCGACGLTIMSLTLTLIYTTEPISYAWAETGEQEPTALCEPILLDQPTISYGTVADFAAEAVVAVNTFDYLDWDRDLPNVLNRYFAPRAGRIYSYQFERSDLLRSIERNYYTVSAQLLRPPIVVSAVELQGEREWTVQVPVRVYYQTGAFSVLGAQTDTHRDQVFTVRVIELPPTDLNYRGVGVQEIANTRIRHVDDLERLQ